ncbi:hypothetical protein [Actinoplanes sp. NPDC026623]|uniref:hypothetical protein n=1 Tax=Actinoplanes sp. NPDC026623 TaxID=3155610 RepID=UPI0033F3CF06
MSSFDLTATIAFGAVMGHAVLGHTPTLTAGLLGTLTLLALKVASATFIPRSSVSLSSGVFGVLLLIASVLLVGLVGDRTPDRRAGRLPRAATFTRRQWTVRGADALADRVFRQG